MKIIDAHLHLSNIQAFRDIALKESEVTYSAKGLVSELKQADAICGIVMGLQENQRGSFPDYEAPNPMIADLEAKLPPQLFLCVGINPNQLQKGGVESLQKLERVLNDQQIVGIKLYPGYYPFYVNDPIYGGVYQLARAYNLPVVIHSGDVFSSRGLLKYSQPLALDEVAVQYPEVNFILAHLGDPWVMEAAELIYKNPNVYADLSGFLTGNAAKIAEYISEPLFVDHFRRAIIYADNYQRFLFGSDWPLVPIKPYLEFVEKLIPPRFHDLVFYQNALRVFPKIENAMQLTF